MQFVAKKKISKKGNEKKKVFFCVILHHLFSFVMTMRSHAIVKVQRERKRRQKQDYFDVAKTRPSGDEERCAFCAKIACTVIGNDSN